MDRDVRDYLIRAHTRVIAHYRQALQGSSLSSVERQHIQRQLAGAEAELASFSGNPSSQHFAQARDATRGQNLGSS